MKDLKNINLQKDSLKQQLLQNLGVSPKQRSEFIFQTHDGIGLISSLNYDGWEHVMVDFGFLERLPSYPEMLEIKDIFWDENEITLQIHPSKSEYINICEYALHLWRYSDTTPQVEQKLKNKIMNLYSEVKNFFDGKKKEILINDENEKKLIIFGGNNWPTWEEICNAKQKYWKDDEAAVQFNISYKNDMNQQFIIILWDAKNFLLPSKEYV